MEATISRVLHDLRAIGKIKIGDKISIVDDRIDIDREGLLQPLVRAIHGSTRCKARNHVTNTVNVAITIICLLRESIHLESSDLERKHTLHNMETEVRSANRGISNMMITYHADQAMVMSLESLMAVISAHVT